MAETHNFQASHLHSITRRIFVAVGATRHIADDVAEILVNANLAGHDSHGVLRIPHTCAALKVVAYPQCRTRSHERNCQYHDLRWEKLFRSLHRSTGDEPRN